MPSQSSRCKLLSSNHIVSSYILMSYQINCYYGLSIFTTRSLVNLPVI